MSIVALLVLGLLVFFAIRFFAEMLEESVPCGTYLPKLQIQIGPLVLSNWFYGQSFRAV